MGKTKTVKKQTDKNIPGKGVESESSKKQSDRLSPIKKITGRKTYASRKKDKVVEETEEVGESSRKTGKCDSEVPERQSRSTSRQAKKPERFRDEECKLSKDAKKTATKRGTSAGPTGKMSMEKYNTEPKESKRSRRSVLVLAKETLKTNVATVPSDGDLGSRTSPVMNSAAISEISEDSDEGIEDFESKLSQKNDKSNTDENGTTAKRKDTEEKGTTRVSRGVINRVKEEPVAISEKQSEEIKPRRRGREQKCYKESRKSAETSQETSAGAANLKTEPDVDSADIDDKNTSNSRRSSNRGKHKPEIEKTVISTSRKTVPKESPESDQETVQRSRSSRRGRTCTGPVEEVEQIKPESGRVSRSRRSQVVNASKDSDNESSVSGSQPKVVNKMDSSDNGSNCSSQRVSVVSDFRRGRGRKKNEVEAANSDNESECSSQSVSGAGRSRRGRGCKKTEVETANSDNESECSSQNVSGVGRSRRGRGQKKPEMEVRSKVNNSDDESTCSSQGISGVVGSRRGRGRKKPEIEEKSKVNNSDNKSTGSSQSVSDLGAARRGRGRKKAENLASTVVNNSNVKLDEIPVRTSRGKTKCLNSGETHKEVSSGKTKPSEPQPATAPRGRSKRSKQNECNSPGKSQEKKRRSVSPCTPTTSQKSSVAAVNNSQNSRRRTIDKKPKIMFTGVTMDDSQKVLCT